MPNPECCWRSWTRLSRKPWPIILAKLSINQVQDGAGFRVAVQSAFSNFMIFHQAGLVRTDQEKQEGKGSLSRVDRALKHLKEK
ncbi:MAG: hypothetical protein HY787_22280 [Deltaproteobacteria bacterium]|nr:hypothetical protein [Deltaproteobacteria bacterium]